MAKIGRNDACPCGSEKKYKKCCSDSDGKLQFVLKPIGALASNEGTPWMVMRRIEAEVDEFHLTPYLMRVVPKKMQDYALDDFFAAALPSDILNNEAIVVFATLWIIFDWVPHNNMNLASFDGEKTVAQNYLKNYSYCLTIEQKDFIDAMSKTYYSIYSVVSVQPGVHLVLKDLLLGTEHLVKDRSASQILKQGYVALFRLLAMNGDTISMGTMGVGLPAPFSWDVLDLKDKLIQKNEGQPLTGALLRQKFAGEVRIGFFTCINVAEDCAASENLCRSHGIRH